MTGLECLREEILKRGGNKAQAEAKVVQMVLEIIAQDDTHIYTDLTEAKKELQRVKTELDWANRELKRIQPLLKDALDKEKEMRVEHDERVMFRLAILEDEQHQLDALKEQLLQCETPERRDAMRCARLFLNNTTVKTTQNNTAFIQGLAQVLSVWKGNKEHDPAD